MKSSGRYFCACILFLLFVLLPEAFPSRALTFVSAPVFTPATNAPLAGILRLATDVPSRVTVSVNDGRESWVKNFYDHSVQHALPLYGFKPDRTNQINISVHDQLGHAIAVEDPLVFITEPLPADFPNIHLLKADRERMEPGFTLFRLEVHNNTYAYAIIIDANGEVVWYGDTPSRADVRQLPNGNLFVPSTNRFVELNLLEETVRTSVVPTNLLIDPHDGVPTDHGTILYLSDALKTVTDYPTSVSDPAAPVKTAQVRYEKIVEVSADDSSLLHTWSPIDQLDPRRISYLVGRIGTNWDSEHSNAIIEDPSDKSLIISMRHQNAVIKMSRAGELRWILGPHDGWGPEWQPYLLKPVGTPFEWQYGQHAPVLTDRHTLMLFDKGNSRAMPFATRVADTNNYTRAVEYRIDETKMEISQIWDYGRTNAAQRIYADHEGNAEPLPQTRNVLIGFPAVSYINGVPPSSFGPGATMVRIQEVTREASPDLVFDVALTMYDNTNSTFRNCSIYRAHRIPDLYGHPAAPVQDLSVQTDGAIAHLTFSADPVRTYSVQASTDLEHWSELGLAETGEEGVHQLDDDDSEHAPGRYYRVVTH